MSKYILNRTLSMVITLIGVSILVFLMMHLIPGDPVTYILGDFASEEAIVEMKKTLGLDQPLFIQYIDYIKNVLQGNLGTSYITGLTVGEEIVARFPITVQLALYSLIIGAVIGILMGILAAVKQNTIFDQLAMVISLIGISAPGFWIALFLIWMFSYQFNIFPISGYQGFYSLILPSITLGLGSAGNIARMTRSSMLEVIKQDFMRTAQAKGLAMIPMIFKHALQNAMIPVITLIGLQFGFLLAGAVVIETVFALPGLGSFSIEAITKRDLPTVQGLVLFMAFLFIITNMIVDLVYSLIDPRIKY
ncbi:MULTISPECIES: ABC transporter permease [Lysinibacillus]|uniref:Peptide/nickel transport system permease protein n=2 Tax=Lysinibacillus TaxID=400634 RepID=A0A1H9KJ22_9BACI|nr:ABC transporter permease [Lysinibacillus fusiformis]HAU35093.1 ABC transporter permease [Lysinibacillus sp.]MCG7436532.1 ABC transporter permease [Lysinibacillus fusiformis]MED4078704.1 ABC transporter permease [Lysinibacillus fusiformis]NOG26959.1 ABC transporter permease [Lysinibacillus fusiformis]SCX57869.1 peptide/nickel transport system permease protein [Lysinibacillus fusiformis]